MEKMIIHGGAPLRGTVTLSGSKNAALPIMMASLLTSEPLHLTNVPRLRDVKTAMDLLSQLGVRHDGLTSIASSFTRQKSPRTKRRTSWSRRCARRSSCSGRCWRGLDALASPRQADARLARGR